MRAFAAGHLGAALAFRILDDDPALGAFDKNDEINDADRHHQQKNDKGGRQRPRSSQFQRPGKGARQVGDDAREDDQRDAVADPARRDLFAQPHQENGSADKGHHHLKTEKHSRIGHRRAGGRAHAFEAGGYAVGLKRRDEHGAVAGILVDLLTAGFAFLFQRLELRRYRRHQLHDNGGRNVGHDIEGEDRHPPQRPAGEHVEHAQHTALVLTEDVLKDHRVDTGERDIGAEAIDDQRTQSEPNTLLQFGGLGEGPEVHTGS